MCNRDVLLKSSHLQSFQISVPSSVAERFNEKVNNNPNNNGPSTLPPQGCSFLLFIKKTEPSLSMAWPVCEKLAFNAAADNSIQWLYKYWHLHSLPACVNAENTAGSLPLRQISPHVLDCVYSPSTPKHHIRDALIDQPGTRIKRSSVCSARPASQSHIPHVTYFEPICGTYATDACATRHAHCK